MFRHRAGGRSRRVCGRHGTGRQSQGLWPGSTGRRDGSAGGIGHRSSTVTRMPGCGGTVPGMWSRLAYGRLVRPAAETPREYASRAGPWRQPGPRPQLSRWKGCPPRREWAALQLQPLIYEHALIVVSPGAGMVAPSPAGPVIMMAPSVTQTPAAREDRGPQPVPAAADTEARMTASPWVS
jgi:hypothetical protein